MAAARKIFVLRHGAKLSFQQVNLAAGFRFWDCEYQAAARRLGIIFKIFTSKGSFTNSETVSFKCLK